MKEKIVRIIYACDRCCTKLTYEGELCPRCHSGRGEQVYPVPKNELPTGARSMCAGVRRLRKHSRNVHRDRTEELMNEI